VIHSLLQVHQRFASSASGPLALEMAFWLLKYCRWVMTYVEQAVQWL
jgi:hypothetical protein